MSDWATVERCVDAVVDLVLNHDEVLLVRVLWKGPWGTKDLANTQADREAKKRELLALTGGVEPEDALPKPAPPAPAPAAAPSRSYDEAKLQIRLTNGKALVQVSLASINWSAMAHLTSLNWWKEPLDGTG